MNIRYLAAALGLAVALGLAGPGSAQETAADFRTLSVSAEGRALAAPDMATLQIGVQRQAETAAEALAATSEATAAVLARIEAAGIAPRDVQTASLTLNPRWEPRPQRDSPPRIVGYEAGNILTVRVRDLDLLGGLLDEAVSDGANTFGGLSFGLSDPEPLKDAARRDAVREAMRRAELYADAAGVELGEVRQINEQSAQYPQPPMMRMEMAMDSGVPVAGGELEITVTVSMVFAIED